MLKVNMLFIGVLNKMSWDIKYISKKTGLTGLEAKNIASKLKKKNIDVYSIDWETIGQDLYGHGRKTAGVKKKLKSMYGISLGVNESGIGHQMNKYASMSRDKVLQRVSQRNDQRTMKALIIDKNMKAKHTFSISNERGVEKWLKNPNRYDLKGIDDI